MPFVPLGESTMDDAVAAAHRFGRLFGDQFSVPVFFYGEAALHSERRELSDIRRGGIEGLRGRITDACWHPDAGPAACHECGGAVAVGARMPWLRIISISNPVISNWPGALPDPYGLPAAGCPASRRWAFPGKPRHRAGLHESDRLSPDIHPYSFRPCALGGRGRRCCRPRVGTDRLGTGCSP